jgi:hypothetical protein
MPVGLLKMKYVKVAFHPFSERCAAHVNSEGNPGRNRNTLLVPALYKVMGAKFLLPNLEQKSASVLYESSHDASRRTRPAEELCNP